jgi:hypothetical protein
MNPCNKSFTRRMEIAFCQFHYSTVCYTQLPVWNFLCYFCMKIDLQILAGDIHRDLSICGLSCFDLCTDSQGKSNTVLIKVVLFLHP